MATCSNSRLLAIADDLTGALETGAQLTEEGIRCAVSANGAVIDVSVLVVNAGTRHLDPGAAALNIQSIVEKFAARGPLPHVYLKTDSTLRGPIAASIASLHSIFPDRKVVYAPAYPALGRTVRDGIVFVDGVPVTETDFSRDQLTPVVESSVLRMIDGAWGGPAGKTGELLLRSDVRVVVVDGASDSHLELTAQQMAATKMETIAAGTGGFVRPWARSLSLQRAATPVRPLARTGLIVVGSRHGRSRSQIQRAAALDIPVFVQSAMIRPCHIAEAVYKRRWAILTTDAAMDADPVATAITCAEAVRAILRETTPEVLAIFGGDTASAILDALGCPIAYPYGELLPGVPVSRAPGEREFILVTKAGGFGNEHLIDDMIGKLEGGS